MNEIHKLISKIKERPDILVLEQRESWLLTIPKGSEYTCEITVPFEVLEWFASVKEKKEKKEVWSDWMDYEGYDKTPKIELEKMMAKHILDFADRTSKEPIKLPLNIYQQEA